MTQLLVPSVNMVQSHTMRARHVAIPAWCKVQMYLALLGLLLSTIVTVIQIYRNPAIGVQLLDFFSLPPLYLPDLKTQEATKSFSDLKYLIANEAACQDIDVTLLVIVISSVPSIKQRVSIRDSWASVTSLGGPQKIKTLFLIGSSGAFGSDEEAIMLREEQAKYSDVIQADVRDTYGYLTQKTGAAFWWVRRYCPGARFVLKSDDDSFNVMRNVMAEISWRIPEEDFLSGECASGLYPYRDRSHKWYVSPDAYPDAYYPLHLKGRAYLLSRRTLDRLLEAAEKARVIPMEDVFWTGIARVLAQVPCTCNSGFVTKATISLMPCDIAGNNDIMNIHHVTPDYMIRYWLWYTEESIQAECPSTGRWSWCRYLFLPLGCGVVALGIKHFRARQRSRSLR